MVLKYALFTLVCGTFLSIIGRLVRVLRGLGVPALFGRVAFSIRVGLLSSKIHTTGMTLPKTEAKPSWEADSHRNTHKSFAVFWTPSFLTEFQNIPYLYPILRYINPSPNHPSPILTFHFNIVFSSTATPSVYPHCYKATSVITYLNHTCYMLRRCAISRTTPGTIPGGVTGFFSDIFLPTAPWPRRRLRSYWKWVPGTFPGGKGGWCVKLTNSPSSCAECHEIWEPKPPGTLWATPGLLGDSFHPFTHATCTNLFILLI